MSDNPTPAPALEPCPNPNCSHKRPPTLRTTGTTQYVQCGSCGMCGPSFAPSQDSLALRGWNLLPRATAGEQVETLKQFARAIIKTRCWGWDGEEDGGTIQDTAERLGIIVPFTVTQEHVDSEYVRDCEAGDTAYKFAPWLADAAALADAGGNP